MKKLLSIILSITLLLSTASTVNAVMGYNRKNGLSQPIRLVVNLVSFKKAKIVWNKAYGDDANSYKVQIKGPKKKITKITKKTSFTVKGLKKKKNYTVKVTSLLKDGNNTTVGASTSTSFSTKLKVPTYADSDYTDKGLSIYYKHGTGNIKMELYKASTKNGAYTKVSKTESTFTTAPGNYMSGSPVAYAEAHFIDTAIKPGTGAYYKARTYKKIKGKVYRSKFSSPRYVQARYIEPKYTATVIKAGFDTDDYVIIKLTADPLNRGMKIYSESRVYYSTNEETYEDDLSNSKNRLENYTLAPGKSIYIKGYYSKSNKAFLNRIISYDIPSGEDYSCIQGYYLCFDPIDKSIVKKPIVIVA